MSLLIVVSLASALFQSPAGPGGASLSGVVVAEDGRTPLPGVEVTLIAMDERPLRGSAHKAVTDADGRYRLVGLQAGRYRVTVQRAGYTRLDAPELPEVSLGAGASREPLNFTLQKGAVIVGRVLDDNGDPVLDAQVIVFRKPPAHLSDVARRSQLPFLPAGQMAPTNDLGEFRIFGLPPHDEYFVHAIPPPDFGEASTASTVLIPTFFPGAPDPIAAQPVAVGAGQTSAEVVIRMISVPALHVSGVVVDEAGRPVPDALVRLKPDDTRQNAFMSRRLTWPSYTDPSGRFAMHNVTSGSYTLLAIAPRVTSARPRGGANSGGSGGIMTFSSGLAGGSTDGGVTTETHNGVTTEYRDDAGTRVPVTIDRANVDNLEITVRRPPR